MNVLLWLDDIRDPIHDKKWLLKFAPEFLNTGQVVWVKSYHEFTSWIELNGLPTKIAFDHDLGFEPDSEVIAKSGYDACHWLLNYCMDNDIELTTQFVYQTDNIVGKENMIRLIKRFKKFQNNS